MGKSWTKKLGLYHPSLILRVELFVNDFLFWGVKKRFQNSLIFRGKC
jgi:hypothetical protein